MKKKRNARVVLFDIDGTLVDTGGRGREAFIRGLARVTGEPDDLAYVSFAGNTDRNVLEQVMAVRGLSLEETLIRRIFAEIAGELRALLAAHPAREIAGAGRFLEQLLATGAVLGLVTGNMRECAYLKLDSAGLGRHFRFGGFGDEHAERTDIARASLGAARDAGIDTESGELVLVGDTPWDVAAGQALGIPVIGVATGRFDEAALRAAGAALTVTDFSDVDGLMGWLETGRGK